MKLKTFCSDMSAEELQRFVRLAGSSVPHVRFQIGNGHSRPSFALATRLVLASRRMYPKQPKRWLQMREWFSMEAVE